MAVGGTPQQYTSEDHCVGLWGYGPSAWLFRQLGVALPSPLTGTETGYLLYTWATIGFVDHAWIMSTVGEAWLRSPTTVGELPAPTPTPTPTPVPPVPTPTPTPVPPTPPTPTPAPSVPASRRCHCLLLRWDDAVPGDDDDAADAADAAGAGMSAELIHGSGGRKPLPLGHLLWSGLVDAPCLRTVGRVSFYEVFLMSESVRSTSEPSTAKAMALISIGRNLITRGKNWPPVASATR